MTVTLATSESETHAPRLCPQCGDANGRMLADYSVDPWRLVQCEACDGFVYLQNAPAYSRLADEFAWEKTSAVERERRRVKYPVVNFIERMTRWRLSLFPGKRTRLYRRLFQKGRVLDVGCASGQSIPEPFIPYGIEISQVLARKAQENMAARSGRAICAPAIEGISQFPDRYFSGVVLSSFLEHEVNPKTLLEQVARVMADDGKAYIRVPNFSSINRHVMGAKWCGFRHPDHVNYFTPKSLRRMARDCGLRMRLINPFMLPFNDNINAVLSKGRDGGTPSRRNSYARSH